MAVSAHTDEEVDFCVIGAGPAGCVVASRLSETPTDRVLLLEAGPRDWHPYIHIPATCLFLQSDARFNWLYQSEPEAGAGNRVFKLSQGKTLGGSSSINGMLHVRGDAGDFDVWAQSGCRGWSYDEVIPYFRRAETYNGEGEGEGEELRGRSGPHAVSDFLSVHPLTKAFVEAAQATGIPARKDMNGMAREGVAYYQQNRKNRFRGQPAQTYLRQAKRRPNLEIRTGAMVLRILFEGRRAIGVEYERDGQTRRVRARREVILSAGAIRSPQILQLSGIGDPEQLRALGVTPLVERPAVGQNLRDHFQLRIGHRVKGIMTLNERTRGLRAVGEALRYAVLGTGLLTMGAGTAAAFFRSREGLATPDAQLIFAPGSFSGPGVLETEPGMTIGGWPSHPESRGTVLARKADPREQPAITLNYLSAEADKNVIIACVRRIREIFASAPLAKWSAFESFPGAAITSDDEVLDFARARATSGLHFAGTCRMGGDEAAVVDPELRVRGVEGLRVVDASIMPQTTVGNTNATVVMIAEKAVDLIRGQSIEQRRVS